MITTEEVRSIVTSGGNVVGRDGSKIGSIEHVYFDDDTGRPEWVTAKTGMFGGAASFVPLEEATVEGKDLTVPFDKSTVKDAPRVEDSDGHLTPEQEKDLYRYYGLEYSEASSTTDGHEDAGPVGRDTSGPTTDDAMTRSEERVNVGTRSEETGRVRLRKYVETEHVTQEVPVRKEKAVLEREPVTDENAEQALDGPAISEEEHEVTLHEERPVVEKETVPVERVRLGTETATAEETVSEDVRKEQIEAEGDVEDRR